MYGALGATNHESLPCSFLSQSPMNLLTEAEVQAAIQGALQAYGRDRRSPLEVLPPFPNMQGHKRSQYCADIVGLLNNAVAILLEVKRYDTCKRELVAFSQRQYKAACWFEKTGVPLAYAYNAVDPLAYQARQDEEDWPEATLGAIKRSVPSKLKSAKPRIDHHGTLLEWLNKVTKSSGADLAVQVGKAAGAIQCARDLRNASVVLLYGVEGGKLAQLSGTELKDLLKIASNNRQRLTAQQLATLETVLEEESRVITRYRAFEARMVAANANSQRKSPAAKKGV